MKKSSLVGIAALTAAALVLAGCTTSSDGGEGGETSGEPIKLAVVYGLTGAFGGTGASAMIGLNAAVEQINDAGGVAGRPIEVNIIDSKSDPTYAVTALTEVLESDSPPDVLVPGGNSPEVLALLPAATDAGLFGVSVATNPATNDPDAYPYYFGISPATKDQLVPVFEELESSDVETLGLLLGADAIGDGWLTAITSVADDAGIEIVATERPATDALSFDVEYQRLLAAEPDAIFSDFSVFDATAKSLTSRNTVGATDIPLYTATGTSTAYPANLVDPSIIENCSMAVFGFTVASDEQAEYLAPFYDAFESEGGTSIYAAGLGWDLIQILKTALERTEGDTDAQTMADALADGGIDADVMALYSTGTLYSAENHFPTVLAGSMTMIPCDSQQVDGLWVTD